MKRILVVAGLIRAGEVHPYAGKILMSRRLGNTHLAHSWEFPGGKVEQGEDPVDALHRELKEELNIEVSTPQVYAVGHHCYPEKEVILMVYECWHQGGEPQALEVSEFKWLSPQEVCELPLPPADEEVIDRLRRENSLQSTSNSIQKRQEESETPSFFLQKLTYQLTDQEATQEWGMLLGQTLVRIWNHQWIQLHYQHALKRLAVYGDLGSGKTTCAQGLATGVGVPEDHYVNSPTFSLLQTHPGSIPFHHIDLYRLTHEEELEHLGFDELMETGIAYIEWPERGPSLFLQPHLKLHFSYLEDPTQGRQVDLEIKGLSGEDTHALLLVLQKAFTSLARSI